MVLAREQRLALEHLSEDTACTPDINLNIVLLPREHNLWRAVVSRRYVSRHLRILNASQTKVADLEIAVLVDENIAGLEITVNNTS
jgi:hypothetical protein